jgi:glycosyltransferase involved in cell wall biosynthesis
MAFFVGNLNDINKNIRLLPKIDKILTQKNIFITWNIAGAGMCQKDVANLWENFDSNRINFHGFLNEIQIEEFLLKCNAMILPSYNEGLPVSVVEAMKKGVIPFVSNWDGALSGLVSEGETGFYADPSNPHEFAEKNIDFL